MKPEGMEALSSCCACVEVRTSRVEELRARKRLGWAGHFELPFSLAGGLRLSGLLLAGHDCCCCLVPQVVLKVARS